MADTTTDTSTERRDEARFDEADSLAGAVDALIDEIDGVCEAFDRSRADDAPAKPSEAEERSGPSARLNDLEAEVDELVADVAGRSPEADEDALIERGRPAAPEGAAPTERAPSSIDDLDAELAAAADEELAGDFDTIEDLTSRPEPEPERAPASDPEPESASEPEPEPAPEPEPVAEAPKPEAAARIEPEPVDETPAKPKRPLSERVIAWVEPVLRALSLPLARLSRMQRDTIGWVALNTLFLAFCVWLFALLR